MIEIDKEIAGYVDNLGYIRCRECTIERAENLGRVPETWGEIYFGSYPHAFEACECGQALDEQ